MLTVYLFCLFLIVYAYLLVPAKRPDVVPVPAAVEPVPTPRTAPKQMPSTIADLTITPEELEGFDSVTESEKGLHYSQTLASMTAFESLNPLPSNKLPLQVKGSKQSATPAGLTEMDATVISYGRMGCVELRRECSANGIKWRVRRNKGKGKGTYYHLSVSEMREALLAAL